MQQQRYVLRGRTGTLIHGCCGLHGVSHYIYAWKGVTLTVYPLTCARHYASLLPLYVVCLTILAKCYIGKV